MASYAALAVQTREYLIIVMWAGQWANEGFNWILKRIIKQERPLESLGSGYGFPSSHSQYMAYFASFLMCHMYFTHQFSATGSRVLDATIRAVVYICLIVWWAVVAYSRYHLGYHNTNQILWGSGIGAVCGTLLYLLAELIPRHQPHSLLGAIKRWCITNPISAWIRIRDGWAVFPDGGRESEWERWKSLWDKQQKLRVE